MAKELRLEKVTGKCAAVHDQERVIAPGACLVNRGGGVGLSGARLPFEENAYVSGGCLFEECEYGPSRQRGPDEPAEPSLRGHL